MKVFDKQNCLKHIVIPKRTKTNHKAVVQMATNFKIDLVLHVLYLLTKKQKSPFVSILYLFVIKLTFELTTQVNR